MVGSIDSIPPDALSSPCFFNDLEFFLGTLVLIVTGPDGEGKEALDVASMTYWPSLSRFRLLIRNVVLGGADDDDDSSPSSFSFFIFPVLLHMINESSRAVLLIYNGLIRRLYVVAGGWWWKLWTVVGAVVLCALWSSSSPPQTDTSTQVQRGDGRRFRFVALVILFVSRVIGNDEHPSDRHSTTRKEESVR